jgi:hypothetical protein
MLQIQPDKNPVEREFGGQISQKPVDEVRPYPSLQMHA